MTEEVRTAPERKSAGDGGYETAQAFDEFMRSFEAFREANDARLDALERRAADVLAEEKVDRIDRALQEQKRALDRLTLKSRRPELGIEGRAPEASEHKAAFDAYIRHGEASGLKRLETKAMAAGTDADGGYLVPEETEREIGKRLAALSPIRAIASVRQVSSSVYRKPFLASGPAVGWVAETASRPQTASPTLVELQYPVMELYAMPAATAALLEDAAVDLDQWIAGEVDAAFAEQEGAAFVAGDGTNKPHGFLDYTTVAESAWAWEKIGYLLTGVSGAFAAADASDVLIDTIYALKAGYRQNAHWVMNRRTQAAIRKLKDGDGNYLWAPPATADGRATIMNFPVAEAEDMPDIGANALAIAFGDFGRGYLIVDRVGVRVLRDPYSQKPYVLFYTTKRVGGGVQDFDAIKLVKFGTA
ncbi:phage major capsid protein [Propylenella binzhouense]|uniref:Phage major capsid protein n=1 Tax=Propylenella binzhouense TaxID=2555902 RepID=A0A964T8F7_9HYPH|nr:phage major capsid protein [Propylenella binzhouense]MYZ50471.1 phage major capsid protein [Propylenella binzhouense]